MKANRRFLRDQDDGASVIVGAILLFALSFLVLVMIQSNFVPVWEEDAEAAHAQQVRSQLTFLKSQMERQTESGIITPLSSPLDLQRGGPSNILSSQNVPPGSFELGTPDSSAFNFSSPELSIATVNDPNFVGLGESWEPVDGDVIEDASRIASLRVRFGVDAKPYTGEVATLGVTDGNGDFAGRFEVELLQMSTNGGGINKAEFFVETFNANGDLIHATSYDEFNQGVPNGQEPPYTWINALNKDFRFDLVLASAEPPFDITLTTTGGMPADFSVSYYQETAGGGTILVGGGSEIVTDYEDVRSSGRLTYRSLAQYFVQQDLVLEYGGLIVVQGDAASMASAPAFAVGTTTNRTTMSWTIPFPITDSGQTITSGTGLVVTTASGHRVITASGPSASFELATEHPDAWANYWRNTFEVAGLTEGVEYTIATTADSATLTVDGPFGGNTYDVSLALQTAQVEVIV